MEASLDPLILAVCVCFCCFYVNRGYFVCVLPHMGFVSFPSDVVPLCYLEARLLSLSDSHIARPLLPLLYAQKRTHTGHKQAAAQDCASRSP